MDYFNNSETGLFATEQLQQRVDEVLQLLKSFDPKEFSSAVVDAVKEPSYLKMKVTLEKELLMLKDKLR